MTKIDIFSGFLGAGKTTLIRKLIAEAYQGEKIVLIENEFGEIAIDGSFLQDAGVEITEMNSGCICCTLVGDFTRALGQVMEQFHPDRILIEPSGVGKLSDVARAVERVEGAHIGAKVTVVDAGKCKMYMRNFGEFFNDQVASADLIVLSRTDTASEAKVQTAAELLKGLNPTAGLITTPWDKLDGAMIREAMDQNGLRAEMERLEQEHHHHDDEDEEHEHHHHHHHEDGEECDDPECECHHHHHDEDEEHEHHHHHHHEDGEECDDPECECHHHHDEEDGEHEHHHHHHHHADEVFTSWGQETPRKYSEAELREILGELSNAVEYGIVLRAKGIVDASDGEWLYFDYVPGETDIRRGRAAVTGRFCVIGSHIQEEALKELFKIG
ncbi:MAG: GTP-binding protein [Eubacteriales bacterium]|nr:GTP-binding protein [Eubacteriales bacterium]